MLSARLSFSFAIVFFRGIFRSISTILQADRIPPCLFHSLSAVYMFCVSRWTFCCCYQACSLHLLFTYLLVFSFFSLNNSFVTDLGACVCQCRYYLSRSLNELLFFAPSRFAAMFSFAALYSITREKCQKKCECVFVYFAFFCQRATILMNILRLLFQSEAKIHFVLFCWIVVAVVVATIIALFLL